ncbi:hypothetical protein ABFS83_02G120100 [Erythranthe nasuta]
MKTWLVMLRNECKEGIGCQYNVKGAAVRTHQLQTGGIPYLGITYSTNTDSGQVYLFSIANIDRYSKYVCVFVCMDSEIMAITCHSICHSTATRISLLSTTNKTTP